MRRRKPAVGIVAIGVSFDTIPVGERYSLVTPSGIRLTQCNPANANGSAASLFHLRHQWRERRKLATQD